MQTFTTYMLRYQFPYLFQCGQKCFSTNIKIISYTLSGSTNVIAFRIDDENSICGTRHDCSKVFHSLTLTPKLHTIATHFLISVKNKIQRVVSSKLSLTSTVNIVHFFVQR